MTSERILKIFGQIDEKYIEEATPCLKSNPIFLWKRWAALAACAAIVILAGASFVYYADNGLFPDSTMEAPVFSDELPMLTAHFISDGMGFEGMMYYDITEADNANPWTEETVLTTLPVYRNLACFAPTGPEAGLTICLSDEELLALAEETATASASLREVEEVTIKSTEYSKLDTIFAPSYVEQMKDKFPVEKSNCLTATTNIGDIYVYGNGNIDIFFSDPISLPEEYSFANSSSSEDAIEALKYLTKRFVALHEFNQPVFESKKDYSYSGEQFREYYVYDGSGDIEEQILHYNFSKLTFVSDSHNENKLQIIRLGNALDCTEKIGDYPLITADTAQKLLLSNNYISSVPSEYFEDGEITKERIAKVELIYRTDNLNEVFLPYYRFYVELTEEDTASIAEGLKLFGAYYVPAVSGEYLTDFPVWDGSFN